MGWFSLLVVGVLGKYVTALSYFPLSWSEAGRCNVSYVNPIPESLPSVVIVDLHCVVPNSETFHWKLTDLRDWTISNKINDQTTSTSRTVVYNITVTCTNGANISLPWPMKVPGLRELHVSYCQLVDKYKNIQDKIDASIADDLRILEVRNSVWLVNYSSSLFDGSLDSLNLSTDFDCGQQTTLEASIGSNVSSIFMNAPDVEGLVNQALTDFSGSTQSPPSDLKGDPPSKLIVKPEDRLIKDSGKVVSNHSNVDTESTDIKKQKANLAKVAAEEAELEQVKLKKLALNEKNKCKYEKLKHIDESIASLTSKHHFYFMVLEAQFPVLEHMNYSYSGLTEFPKELSQWRIYFPALRYLDISHNLISQVEVARYPSSLKDIVEFDLRYNNITTINMDLIRSLAAVPNFSMNIRENPIHCGCEMSSFLPYLKNESTFTGVLTRYKYVTELYCNTPEVLRGKQLYTLTQDSLICPDFSSDKTAIIVLAIFSSLLVIIIIIFIRFKVEIRILLYTRLHIRLPCDSDEHRNNKIYDAFISYSNEDTTWVCENLVSFLEKSPISMDRDSDTKSSKTENRLKTFKLCVHQRDFIPGKTIFDNIVDSIEASRHTIIVLSPSFMKSHWAMEELRQAYRQSLVEKTRHLIVILLEKVSKEDMDPLISRCCKTFTYLEVEDSLFRDRLVFSLTTKDRGARRRDRLAAKEKKMSIIGSQLENSAINDTLYETNAQDNLAFSSYASRPAEPVRELSNMSTSSLTILAPL